jgi:hypothetical protein
MTKDQIQFTRYLYIKQEVCLAIIISILNKSEDALFWIYELYYSGFKQTIINLIWHIYYDFYAILNPGLESYLYQKTKKIILNNLISNEEAIIIGNIIMTFLFRPFNLDSFIIYYGIPKIDTIKQPFDSLTNLLVLLQKETNKLDFIVKHQNINSISNKNMELMYKSDIFLKDDILKDKFINTKLIQSQLDYKQIKKGKNIYIKINPEDIIIYEMVKVDENIRNYHVLEKACICGINDFHLLHLFDLERENKDIKDIYTNQWLYYCYETPFWNEKILKYGGKLYKEKKLVQFNEETDDGEENMQQFYQLYGYEPDEQKISVQNKSIIDVNLSPNIQMPLKTWNDLILKYKDVSIINPFYYKINNKIRYI